jgi:DNA-binding NarL/FixJ family response regulator
MEEAIRILLVDDHQIVLDGIKSMLANHPDFVIKATALSGEEAWTMVSAAKGAFDLVITDISMPGMSGTELCRKIKALDCSINVLILSMHNQVEYVKEALACEADGYILKNSGRAELVHALETLMARGSFFSHEIVPLLYKEVKAAKQAETTAKLTQRESEVLQLILKEHTSKEIAEKLFISKQTVDSHRMSIMDKTGSKSVVGLIKYAIKSNLIGI